MKKSIYLILIMTTLQLLSACKEENTVNPENVEKPDKIGIITEKNSAVRIQPYIYSTKITELRRGTKVNIMEQSAETSYIAGMKNHWFRIRLDDGIVGWIYGANLKIFEENAGSSIDSYSKVLKQEEVDAIRKELSGKWWSINRRGDFTSHLLKIYPDGKYFSQRKQSKEFKGEFEIDPAEQVLTFSNGTSTGKTLTYSDRGGEFFLEYKDKKDNTWSFKRIAMEPDSNEEKILTVED